jgi:hypothetical protein
MIPESVCHLRLSTKRLRIQIEFLPVKLKEKYQAVIAFQHSKTALNNEKTQKIQIATMIRSMLGRVLERYCEGWLKFVTDEGCL